jgi:uncharacterized membrane-anchored protein
MKGKKIIFIVFGLILLLIPLYIMFQSEDILVNGNRHKIRLQAYDPFDPFRGKYLLLNYDNSVNCDNTLKDGDECYVTLKKDTAGFSYFDYASAEKPEGNDYFKSTVEYMGSFFDWGNQGEDWPEDIAATCNFSTNNFSKYFINEDQAERAEDYVIAYQRESPDKIYVAIRVLDGEVRLEDIYIEEMPLKEFLAKEEEKNR